MAAQNEQLHRAAFLGDLEALQVRGGGRRQAQGTRASNKIKHLRRELLLAPAASNGPHT